MSVLFYLATLMKEVTHLIFDMFVVWKGFTAFECVVGFYMQVVTLRPGSGCKQTNQLSLFIK
jgi:hypothetical protein